MSKLRDWLKESDEYEFCKSYGVKLNDPHEFVDRQEDFYITLLSVLHDVLDRFYESSDSDNFKEPLLELVKGLLVFSQRETSDAFHGVRSMNNQLYVAAIYYLCDYPAISSWVMNGIKIYDYNIYSAQLLSFIVTGGKVANDSWAKENCYHIFKPIEEFILSGDDSILDELCQNESKRYEDRDFESPTDFYMTSVLRCVLKKFKSCNIWKTLRDVDKAFDWTVYVKHSYAQHILSFLPSQQDAINKGLLAYSGSFSLKMPTSAGKSYLTELLIHYELTTNPDARILYLAPLRALSRELRDRFKKISKSLRFTYATKYGGSVASVMENDIDDAQVLISTPESFMSLEGSEEMDITKYTLVICDEGQLLDDFKRGINYELLLSRLRKQENTKFLFISAIIPNIDIVNKWLRGTDDHIGNSTYRPSKIVLAEAFTSDKDITLNVYDDLCNSIKYTIPSFISKVDAQTDSLRKYDSKKRKYIVSSIPSGCALAIRSLKAGSVLLFSTSKKTGISCTALATYMIRMVDDGALDDPRNYVSNTVHLNNLLEYTKFLIGEKHLLCQSLAFGFAFHHGDIPQELREKIERAYDKGLIRLIISNTTLAEGVNLPIKTLVLANVIDYSTKGLYLSNSRLKNIIGRVGRAGRERYGTIIVPVAKHNNYLMTLVKQALDSDDSALDKIRGTLYDLITFLSKRSLITNENDVDELLSVHAFADAIDEMIVRSTHGEYEQIDLDALVTDSLAYRLSDETKRNTLKAVFAIRHNALSSQIKDGKYQLIKATGLNSRDLDVIISFVTDEHVVLANEVSDVSDESFVSFMIDAVSVLPTLDTALKLETKRKQKLYEDSDRLKRIAIQWLKGLQYHEIAANENLSVDDSILEIMYLQGIIHDKAVKIIAYLTDVKGVDNGVVKYWPEYLKLGICNRLMFELHKLRIPDRIQLFGIYDYLGRDMDNLDNYDFLEMMLTERKDSICQHMKQKGYPVLCIDELNGILSYMMETESPPAIS